MKDLHAASWQWRISQLFGPKLHFLRELDAASTRNHGAILDDAIQVPMYIFMYC
jgi:hypothetical protein